MTRVKAHELRNKSKQELIAQLNELKAELQQLRVNKVSGQGGPTKLSKIRVVRKAIARVNTVYNQLRRNTLRSMYRKSSYKPLDLRVKKTRAMRRALTAAQASKKTLRQKKRDQNFPIRKYALKA